MNLILFNLSHLSLPSNLINSFSESTLTCISLNQLLTILFILLSVLLLKNRTVNFSDWWSIILWWDLTLSCVGAIYRDSILLFLGWLLLLRVASWCLEDREFGIIHSVVVGITVVWVYFLMLWLWLLCLLLYLWGFWPRLLIQLIKNTILFLHK